MRILWGGRLAVCLLGSLLATGCQHGLTECCYRYVQGPRVREHYEVAAVKSVSPPAGYLPAPDAALVATATPKGSAANAQHLIAKTSSDSDGALKGPETAELPADGCLGHADDYSWIAGELWYAPGQGGWRVHYAAEKEDKYGGVLTLASVGPLHDYKIGQAVYLEGHPLDGTPKVGSAVYQVNKILEQIGPQIESMGGTP